MKKIFLLLFVLLCVIFFAMPALATDLANPPDGFRDIKFGTDLSKVSGMRKINLNLFDVQAWMNEGDRLFIGDVPCLMISYYTFNNKFYQVMINFDTVDDNVFNGFLSLGKILIEKYGNPDQNLSSKEENSDIHLAWKFKNDVTVQFIHSEENANNTSGMIAYTYMPIHYQWIENSKKLEKQIEDKKEEERKESIKKDL